MVTDVRDTATHFQRTVEELPAPAWNATIRPFTGELCTPRRILVIRPRELELHHVDLAVGQPPTSSRGRPAGRPAPASTRRTTCRHCRRGSDARARAPISSTGRAGVSAEPTGKRGPAMLALERTPTRKVAAIPTGRRPRRVACATAFWAGPASRSAPTASAP
nr:hypothetical protein [Streptomyces montanus]